MFNNETTISLCHWDGYETLNKKCELYKGAEIIKNKFGLSTIKIYVGNKYKEVYDDCKNLFNIKSVKELLESEPYNKVLKLGFKTIVMVLFTINVNGDDYWRLKGVNKNEINQMVELSEYLGNNFSDTEFIISNWESDCVLESTENRTHQRLYAENIIDLINKRYETTKQIKNVKIALEVNRYYNNNNTNSISYILPKVNCDMISYSCYQTIYNYRDMDFVINKIKSLMKPNMELYIGEFGYPTPHTDYEENVLNSLNYNLRIFKKHKIRLAFYWNLYCNEKRGDKFIGFGIIKPNGDISYVYNKLFISKRPVYLARHGISLSNQWKRETKTDYINKEDSLKHNLYDSELTFEGINLINNSKYNFWKDVINNSINIKIYLSPLKRSIQTFIESMHDEFKYEYKQMSVIISPILSEYGTSYENYYMSINALEIFPNVIKLRNLVKDVTIVPFPDNKWIVDRKDHYNKDLVKTLLCNETDTKVYFGHWGIINKTYGLNLPNFGINNFYIKIY